MSTDRLLAGDGPLDVVVTLGTDHHPFGRLVRWVDDWAAAHPGSACLVQHGTAPPPRHAEGHVVLDPADIPGLMARARIVVGHAGPGTILDARAAGRLPVIVPRRAAQGEVVDDHQVAFGRWMDQRGQAICVDTAEDLHHHIEASADDPSLYAIVRDGRSPPPAVVLLGELIDGVLAR